MTSFLPIAHEAHICLRCQYRFANCGVIRPRTAQYRPEQSQRRSFSARSQHRQEHALVRDGASEGHDFFDTSASPETSLNQHGDDIELPKDARTPRNLRDAGFYFRRANLYSKDALDITTLGRPVEVLRLQDGPPRNHERKWWLMEKDDNSKSCSTEPLTSSEILDTISAERGLVSAARAIENIDAVKQEWHASLKDKQLGPSDLECYNLGKRVHDGFTTKQLLDYINKPIIRESPVPQDLNHPFQFKTYTRSEWKIGVTTFPGDAAQGLQNEPATKRQQREPSAKANHATLSYETRRTKSPFKYTLVNRIMRQNWNIRSREELRSIGEVNVRIHEAHLDLISSHKRDILRRLATEHDAKIDFSKGKGILRITANQPTCAASLKLLSMILADITCHTVSLDTKDGPNSTPTALYGLFNNALLREVERLTSTVIRWYQSDSSKEQRPPKDPLRVAQTGAFFGGTKAASVTLAAIPVEASKSLPLTDRGINWTRISSDKKGKTNYGQNTAKSSADYYPSKALTRIRKHIQPSDDIPALSQHQHEYKTWNMIGNEETSAVLGQVLYPAKKVGSKNASLQDLIQPHVLNTDVPSMRRTLEVRGTKMDLREEFRIKFYATNRVVLNQNRKRNLPDLELRCVVRVPSDRPEEPGEVILDSVRLVLEEKQADLLLPHEDVDIRFTTQTYLHPIGTPDGGIEKLMESCNITSRGFDPLTMPKELTVRVPRHVSMPEEQASEPGDAESLVHYSLANIERHWILHCQTVGDPGRQRINHVFSTIDAGAFGGRRQEMRFFKCSSMGKEQSLVTEDDGKHQVKLPNVDDLYRCAHSFIKEMRFEYREKMAPAGWMGGRKPGQPMVRRRLSDVPVGSDEYVRSKLGPPKHKARIRRLGTNINTHPRSHHAPSIACWNTSHFATRRIRHYATVEPGDPQDPKEKDKNTKKDESSIAGNGSTPGKPAPGFEQLYKDQGVMSSTPSDAQKAEVPKGPRLTKKEMQSLDNLLGMVRRGMPTEQAKIIERAFDDIKREGIPQELREILDARKSGKSLDIATMARLVRVTSKMAWKNAEKEVDRPENERTGSSDTSGSSSSSSDSSKKQDSQGSKGSSPSSYFMEIKLDNQTLFLAAFIAYMLYRTLMPSENSKNITWQEFQTTFLSKGLVEKLTVINKSNVRVDLHREATAQVYPESPAQHANFHYYFTIGSVEALERNLEAAQQQLGIPQGERIPVAYTNEESWLATLYKFTPLLLLLGLPYLLSRRGGTGMGSSGGLFGIGKSRAKKFNHETDVKVKFKDVAGMDEAKAEIMEFVSFLREPETYSRLGAKIPRGAILSGPPGTGKTLLAKATAGESGVPFFSVSGSEFVEMFVGVGPSRVRDLFANARKNTPCIIFVDEIDAIGKKRGAGVFGGDSEREATLNQLLTEMDGFNTSEQVVVLAGTNRPDVLDGALMRPGRFDRHINIDAPTMEGRKQIFKVHVAKIITDDNVEYMTGRLAALTPGFSGADIANCVNEAALTAARTNATKVVMSHFESAIERVIGGLENKSRVLNPTEKRTVAYHEAGHAICGWFFKHADPLLKVSIIPRGKALGYAQNLPDSENYLLSMHQLMDRMAMTLGGRVSEELHFDTVTSGASDDFNKVTRMATAMVTKLGMSSKIGFLYFEDDDGQKLHKPFSEETARNIDSEVRRIVQEAYKQCRDLLSEKKKEVGLVAEELLRKEMLVRDDLVRILGKRPFQDNKEFSKYFEGEGGKSAPDVAPDVPPAVAPAPAM
ncbi:MAG: hypothetical protein Q9218_004727 [Villophora microphyllina]